MIRTINSVVTCSFIVLAFVIVINANEEFDVFIEKATITNERSSGSLGDNFDDFGILETDIDTISREKRRIRLARRSKFRSGSHHDNSGSENNALREDDDNYHVRYSTKFAFQNVDEFGLKVKYNKSENVYYGDSATSTESPLSVIPLERGSQISEPAALTYMASNDVEKPMKIIQMDDNYPKVPDSEKATTEEFKTINRVQRSLMDEKIQFPYASKVIFGPEFRMANEVRNGWTQPQVTRFLQDPIIPPVLGHSHTNGEGEFRSSFAQHYDNFEGSRPKTKGAKGSRELNECRSMDFQDGENAKDMTGICLMCLRNEDEYGHILFSVKGCPAVDCEEFELPNPYDPYPFCCPVCKGARRKYREEDLMYGTSMTDENKAKKGGDGTPDDESSDEPKGDEETDEGDKGDEDEAKEGGEEATDDPDKREERSRRFLTPPEEMTKITHDVNNVTVNDDIATSENSTTTTMKTEVLNKDPTDKPTAVKRRLFQGKNMRSDDDAGSNAQVYRRRLK